MLQEVNQSTARGSVHSTDILYAVLWAVFAHQELSCRSLENCPISLPHCHEIGSKEELHKQVSQ